MRPVGSVVGGQRQLPGGRRHDWPPTIGAYYLRLTLAAYYWLGTGPRPRTAYCGLPTIGRYYWPLRLAVGHFGPPRLAAATLGPLLLADC